MSGCLSPASRCLSSREAGVEARRLHSFAGSAHCSAPLPFTLSERVSLALHRRALKACSAQLHVQRTFLFLFFYLPRLLGASGVPCSRVIELFPFPCSGFVSSSCTDLFFLFLYFVVVFCFFFLFFLFFVFFLVFFFSFTFQFHDFLSFAFVGALSLSFFNYFFIKNFKLQFYIIM